ncbi:tetraspanin-9 [Halyomorpha halys]|uniref:tetraspanin-9 n=1 Tax=Halyomorpha halys TaxID=286706 RepID=UPI0006D527DF|nr:tetraspanin-9-like [Halyomorpha halys]
MSRSGYTCVRYVFCYVNVLLWLSGCGILGVGIWLRAIHDGYTSLVPQYSLLSADILLIIVGATTVLITFFACCGSWFQSRCMLVTYFSLVIFMFLIEFILATLAFIYRENLNDILKEELMDGIRFHYRNSTDNGLEVIWSKAHTKFHCCGINNYEDWYEIKAWEDRRIVPVSCCLPQYQNMTNCWEEGNIAYWYSKGCSEQVLMWFVSQLHIVGVIGLLISFIQLFGLISAMLLFCTVQHKRVKGHIYKAYSSTSYPS